MAFASGKMALRVRMEVDLLAQRLDLLFRRPNRLPYSGRCRTANNVMDRQYRSKFQALIKAGVEYGIDRLQFIEPQILKLALFLQAEFHRLADLFVRQPRRNAALDQISRRCP